MYYSKEVISYLQHNHILALKFDRALAGVGKAVSNQINSIGLGAKRALYYTSCFTDEYQDVCQRQKIEDIRFSKGVIYLVRKGDVIYEMLKIYFEELFKYKTPDQIDHIKKLLMSVNIYIAASSLTNAGFALATASYVAVGMNLTYQMTALTSNWVSKGIMAAGIYGVIQKAADSAHRLQLNNPLYYSALYGQELEMMYFLIEPLFERIAAFNISQSANVDIADIIIRMVR